MAAFLAMSAVSAGAGIIQGIGATRRARDFEEKAQRFGAELASLEANRQDIPDLAQNIQDRSGMIQNQMANLQVATQAAEFQAEEADVALANTLSSMRAAGFGSGGATSLAQAALRSKRDIAASIEQQEARNVLLRAQGAQTAEGRRLEEGARVDRARMVSEQFGFQAQEARDIAKMDRLSALQQQAEARGFAERQAAREGFGKAFGAVAGVAAGGLVGKGSFMENLNALGYNNASGLNTTSSLPSGDVSSSGYTSISGQDRKNITSGTELKLG